jgi:glutamate transport system permease protein
MNAIFENLDLYWLGFSNTVRLLVVTMLIALPAGILLAAMRISPIAALRGVAIGYVELMRNTPLTLIFFFMAFVLPRLVGPVDFELAAVLSLTLYTSAFFAEAVRSGINAVPIGQAEAARSIGLGFSQSLGNVILPQAVRSVVPPIINVTIALTKNTSVAAGFFIVVLPNVFQRLTLQYAGEAIPIFIGVAVCYLIITVPLGQLGDRLEKRWRIAR